MAYNLGTVRGRIQQKLDDTNFETAKLNQFINDGQRDILNSRRFVFMEREADVTTTSGSQLLSGLPTNMQTPLSLRVYSPTGYALMLTYMEYEDLDTSIPNVNLVGRTVPQAWYVFNLAPLVYPIADNTYTLKLKYIKAPDELASDSDVPEVPEAFSELIVLAGYKRALEHNDDFDQAQVVQIQIENHMNKLDDRYKRQDGLPHIMRQPNRVNRPFRSIRGL